MVVAKESAVDSSDEIKKVEDLPMKGTNLHDFCCRNHREKFVQNTLCYMTGFRLCIPVAYVLQQKLPVVLVK